ncbi:hypothetical protein ACH5RR_023234 [Cinchona calisaya]|uniref:H(+)-transporting two-sector ATPase n=1 Tax=Cinchona calisaya TaxID=153742 RepID=A0ABD2ZDZ0_9GENT
MPQLDKFTYFTQFFWSCLFLLTFYIIYLMETEGKAAKMAHSSFPSVSRSCPNRDEKKDLALRRTLYHGHFQALTWELQAQAEGLSLHRVHHTTLAYS